MPTSPDRPDEPLDRGGPTEPTLTRQLWLEFRRPGAAAPALPAPERVARLLDPEQGAFVADPQTLALEGDAILVRLSPDRVRFELLLADGWYDEEHGEWHGGDEDGDEANEPLYAVAEEAARRLQRALRWPASVDPLGVFDTAGDCPACEAPFFDWEQEMTCARCGASLEPGEDEDEDDEDDEPADDAEQERSVLARLAGPPLPPSVAERVAALFARSRGGREPGTAWWLLSLGEGHDVRVELTASEVRLWLYAPAADDDEGALPERVFDRCRALIERVQGATRWPVAASDWFWRSEFGVLRSPCPGCGAAVFGWEASCGLCRAPLPADDEVRSVAVAHALLEALLEADEIEVNDEDDVVTHLSDSLESGEIGAAELLAVLEDCASVDEVFADETSLGRRLAAARASALPWSSAFARLRPHDSGDARPPPTRDAAGRSLPRRARHRVHHDGGRVRRRRHARRAGRGPEGHLARLPRRRR